MTPPHRPLPHPHGYGLAERLILQSRAGGHRDPRMLPMGVGPVCGMSMGPEAGVGACSHIPTGTVTGHVQEAALKYGALPGPLCTPPRAPVGSPGFCNERR